MEIPKCSSMSGDMDVSVAGVYREAVVDSELITAGDMRDENQWSLERELMKKKPKG